jgi:diaminopimelate decarboxylase
MNATHQSVFTQSPADWEALAQRYGTPYYLFDGDAVCRRIEDVRNALESNVEVYYAVKANPNLALLRTVAAVADGADISSGGELEQALRAGFDAADMSFAGPAKTDDELQAAIEAGVGCISAESVNEIERCARLAARLGRRARILVRVNPKEPARTYGLKMGGRPIQFGIDEECLDAAVALLMRLREHVECRGIHTYVGSQCFDPAGIADTAAAALAIADRLASRLELHALRINLGGGFGVSHGSDHRELDLQSVASRLVPLLTRYRAAREGHCTFIFELGRYLTAAAGIYVTRVIDVKTSRGKRFVTCDGGLNHHLGAAGTFGAAIRANYPLLNLSRPEGKPVACSVAGPSCNPTDLLGIDAVLPELAAGDLVGVTMSGASGLTASPLLFLGRDTPAELVRTGSGITLGRRRFRAGELNV